MADSPRSSGMLWRCCFARPGGAVDAALSCALAPAPRSARADRHGFPSPGRAGEPGREERELLQWRIPKSLLPRPGLREEVATRASCRACASDLRPTAAPRAPRAESAYIPRGKVTVKHASQLHFIPANYPLLYNDGHVKRFIFDKNVWIFPPFAVNDHKCPAYFLSFFPTLSFSS